MKVCKEEIANVRKGTGENSIVMSNNKRVQEGNELKPELPFNQQLSDTCSF